MVAGRDQPRHGLAVLGDDNSIGVCPVEEGQALFLEFRGGDGFHGHILQLVINYVHFLESNGKFNSASFARRVR